MEVDALKNRPRLTMWTTEYWEGYQVLTSSRMVHQGGIGPIPLSEMVAYMDAIDLTDVDDRLRFIRMMQALDKVYVKHINERAKRESEKRRQAAMSKGKRKTR